MTDPQFTLFTEEWKEIPDYPEYEVSNLGRVRRAIASSASPKGKILSVNNEHIYPSVTLCRNGRRTPKNVHRLVALAFLGSPPIDRPFVNHLNGNKADCRLSNLQYCSAKENTQHAIHQLGKKRSGQDSACTKFTPEIILAIHNAMMNGESPVKIMRQYEISETQLYRIKFRHVHSDILAGLPTSYPPPKPWQRGSLIGTAKLTESQVREIRSYLRGGCSRDQIAIKYGVSKSTIEGIAANRSWKHVT
jgi:hypothetical protein